AAALIASGLVALVNAAAQAAAVSTGAVAMYSLLTLVYVAGSRVLARELLYFQRGSKDRVLVYGAGSAGAQLVRSLRETGQCTPVALVDDDPALHRRVIAGAKVYAPSDLPELIARESIASVFLAMPSSSRRQRQAGLKLLEAYPVHVRTVPAIGDILCGHATISD